MLYIRADMNESIATGHIMRCLAIADAAKSQNEDTTFILADSQALELVQRRGYQAVILHTLWDDMEGELPALLGLIKRNGIEKMLLDSYQVTEPYLSALTSQIKTIYIDDRNSFIYPVSGLVCYANYWKKFNYSGIYNNTKLIMGPGYVPLRKEFCHCSEKVIKDKTEELLLLSGGTDPYNVLKSILDILDKSRYKKINVICGRYYADYESLYKEYFTYDNVRICQAVSNMEDYMLSADVAVSAGGTTLYELCACGTPTISYSFADNQLDNVQQFQEDGIIDYAGDARNDNIIENIIGYLQLYNKNFVLRLEHSRKMQKLVDGRGALRIVKALKEI